MSDLITEAYPINIEVLDPDARTTDPVELGVLDLNREIGKVLARHPDAGTVSLVDEMPDCRSNGWDDNGYRQRLPLPDKGVELTSTFERTKGAVKGSIVLPSINRQDCRTYVLNEAEFEGVEVPESYRPGFSMLSLVASRRFFAYRADDSPYIAKRDFEPERYLRELNASLDFLHRDRSGCRYVEF